MSVSSSLLIFGSKLSHHHHHLLFSPFSWQNIISSSSTKSKPLLHHLRPPPRPPPPPLPSTAIAAHPSLFDALDLSLTKEAHELIHRLVFTLPCNSCNTACSHCSGAVKVFDEMPGRDDLANYIKSLCSDHRLTAAAAAFSVFRYHYSSSFLLHPISSLFALCTKIKAVSQGRQLHSLVISLGYATDRYILARLTSFYSNLGFLADAEIVSRNCTSKDPFHWNLLISVYSRTGLWRETLNAYEKMTRKGVVCDRFTYPAVLRACGELFDLTLGQEIHMKIINSGLEFDSFVWNSLVAMYAKCGKLDFAKKLFDEMIDKDVVSWNSMISGYMAHGMWDGAFVLIDQMRAEGLEANTVTWNTIIGGNVQMEGPMVALELVAKQLGKGMEIVDHVTLIICLSACSKIRSLRLSKVIHGIAVRSYSYEHENIRNALITMYFRCGSSKSADVLFEMDVNKSLITWNCMISGLASQEKIREACEVFRDMIRCGVNLNEITLLAILRICGRSGSRHYVQELHSYIIRNGLQHNGSLCNALLDIYCKLGRLPIARRIFDRMAIHDLVSYTSLISGYGMQQDGETALYLFAKMIHCGIRPDHVTMVAVLSACANSRLVSRGIQLFNNMERDFGIVPRLEHFSCMVDLYVKAGLLKKAEKFIKNIPLRPSHAMWASLVKACYFQRNLDVGLVAAKELLDMRPATPNHYILICHMYMSAGYQEELVRVRALMVKMGML